MKLDQYQALYKQLKSYEHSDLELKPMELIEYLSKNKILKYSLKLKFIELTKFDFFYNKLFHKNFSKIYKTIYHTEKPNQKGLVPYIVYDGLEVRLPNNVIKTFENKWEFGE